MEAPLSRRDRERLMRRQAMLRAARAVFAEKGYSNATLDEVAHRAEFGKGTLYNYFEGGKEEILFAIFDEFYDGVCRLIEESFAAQQRTDQPFRAVFHTFLQSTFAFFQEHQDLFIISMKEAHWLLLSEDQQKTEYFMHQQERVLRALMAPIEAAIASGELRPMRPEAIAHLVLGNVKGLQMHLCLSGRHPACGPTEPMTPEQAADFLTTMLLDGLLAQPAPQPLLHDT